MSQALVYATELNRPVDGADTDTWGPLEAGVSDAWDRHFGGRANLDVTSADVTLSTSEAQCHHISAFGTPVADRNLVFPSRNRLYFVRNGSGRTLSMHVTGFSGNKLYIPNGAGQIVSINTAGETRAVSVPTHRDGGHPNSITHQGKSYSGPGVFCEDVEIGIGREADGVMGLYVVDGGSSVRINGTNTAAAPLVGLGNAALDNYTTGFYRSSDAAAWARLGVHQGLLGQGLVVGSATGGEKGVGTVNSAAAYYRNNVALPFQTIYAQTGLSVAAAAGATATHSLGGAPAAVMGWLRATAANAGYAIGDRIPAPAGIVLGASATDVFYRVTSGSLTALHKTTGVSTTLTNASWVLDLTAYA